MPAKVYVSGAVLDPQDACISVFDRGFLYGDSVFETMRIYGGVPFELRGHLERLRASGERIGFDVPWSDAQLRTAIDATLSASAMTEATMRVIATRGSGVMGLDPSLATNPQLIVMVLDLPPLPEVLYTEGRSARLVSVFRTHKRAVDPRAKTGNYLNSVLASAEASARGAQEAIMLASDGRVAEASAANVFALVDGVWCTPPLDVGILSGITRETILMLCASQGIPCEERVLWPADLERAAEIFLCASVREIVPVVKLDDAPVGQGTVGDETRRLRVLYAAEVERTTAAHGV